MGYNVVWPKVSVTVNGKRKVLEQGASLPDGVSDVDRDNLVSFGAISGAPAATEAPADDTAPRPGSAAFILAEVGDDKVKAQAALDEEKAKDKPGKGLVADLEKILGA